MSSKNPPLGGAATKTCQRCGVVLLPNEARCGKCGYVNVPGQGGNAAGKQPPTVLPRGGPPQGQPPTTATKGGPMPQGRPAPGQIPSGIQQRQPPPGAQGAKPPMPSGPSPVPLRPGASGQYGVPGQQRPPAMNSGSFRAAPGQRFTGVPPMQGRGSGFHSGEKLNLMSRDDDSQQRPPDANFRIMIGVIVLVVILASAGLGGIVYINSLNAANNAQTEVKPTPTPDVAPLFDDLFNNNNNGWNTDSDPAKYSVKVGQGAMILEDKDNKLLWEMVPGDRKFDDFLLSVDAELTKGDPINGYGFYIRGGTSGNNDLATYYRFAIYGDQAFAIFKGVTDGNGKSSEVKLVDYTFSPAIKKNPATKDGANHLAVEARGSSLTFMVNGETVKTVSDSTYKSGTVALYVSNLKGAKAGAEAKFSNLAIYPLK